MVRITGLCPLPASAETVASYIAECAGRLKVGSIQRRLNAIAEAHKAVGLESPTHSAIVANTMGPANNGATSFFPYELSSARRRATSKIHLWRVFDQHQIAIYMI